MGVNNRAGKAAEKVARFLYITKGYRIVAQNVTAPRGSGAGEIDIIATKNNLLVFAEVKKRASTTQALYAVTPHQQQRIITGAELYLAQNPGFADYDIRFDAVVFDKGLVPHHLSDAWRP